MAEYVKYVLEFLKDYVDSTLELFRSSSEQPSKYRLNGYRPVKESDEDQLDHVDIERGSKDFFRRLSIISTDQDEVISTLS